jgi:serine/threonine protein kinase
MLKHATAATTRTVNRVRTGLDRAQVLSPGRVVASPETRLQYRIEQLLGEGGFGQVYLATRLGRSPVIPKRTLGSCWTDIHGRFASMMPFR